MTLYNNHAGMLSKSRGQYLRVAATLHVLLNWKTHNIPTTISNEALKAAEFRYNVCAACFLLSWQR